MFKLKTDRNSGKTKLFYNDFLQPNLESLFNYLITQSLPICFSMCLSMFMFLSISVYYSFLSTKHECVPLNMVYQPPWVPSSYFFCTIAKLASLWSKNSYTPWVDKRFYLSLSHCYFCICLWPFWHILLRFCEQPFFYQKVYPLHSHTLIGFNTHTLSHTQCDR